ncbi:MAG: hypothetical protein ACLP3C_01405 [Mycobacterium sp.]|uniref:hypothetical protein n=1 Tax=Mycobacterium sp. TaxID=1785 RepID=UPI003F943867
MKNKLDELTIADQLDLDALFATYVRFRDADIRCGGLALACSVLDALDPPQRQWNGVHGMPTRRAQCDELYKGMTLTAWLEQVLSLRADRLRAQHRRELDAEAHAQVQAAEEAARTAAAGHG